MPPWFLDECHRLFRVRDLPGGRLLSQAPCQICRQTLEFPNSRLWFDFSGLPLQGSKENNPLSNGSPSCRYAMIEPEHCELGYICCGPALRMQLQWVIELLGSERRGNPDGTGTTRHLGQQSFRASSGLCCGYAQASSCTRSGSLVLRSFNSNTSLAYQREEPRRCDRSIQLAMPPWPYSELYPRAPSISTTLICGSTVGTCLMTEILHHLIDIHVHFSTRIPLYYMGST